MIPDWVRKYTIGPADRLFDDQDDAVSRAFLRAFPWASDEGVFLFQAFGADQWPSQGWKLHVSATPRMAVDVLEAVIPTLQRAGVRFKAVSSAYRLLEFNSGLHGLSQVGKFITVYPSSDEQAVELAMSLDEATRSFGGPAVPSDRPLRPASLVHYRYGSFRDPERSASAANMLGDAEGRLIPDQRQPWYVKGPRRDPFRHGDDDDQGGDRKPLMGRFLVLDALNRSAWGRVYDVIDLDAHPPERRVLKEYWHDVSPDVYGRDSREHATLEASILAGLPARIPAPRLIDWIESDGNVYLLLEYVPGRQLADEESRSARVGSARTAVDLAREIAQVISEVNHEGIVHRDVKPSNLLVLPSGRVAPVDFAFAYRLGADTGPPIGYGTPGFTDPDVSMSVPPSMEADVFGWGASMHWLLTGSHAPTAEGEERRPIRDVREDVPKSLASLVDRSVDRERAQRPKSLDEVLAELGSARCRAVTTIHPLAAAQAATTQPDWASAAETLAKALMAAAEPRGPGLAWPSPGKSTNPVFVANLYSGAAGIGLVLSRMAARFDQYRPAIEGVLRWLGSGEFGQGSGQVGLYTGDSGIGFLFLSAARDLKVPAYVDMAILRARRLMSASVDDVDLVEGSAGRLLFLAELARTTGEAADRTRAMEAAANLRGWVDRVLAGFNEQSSVPLAWRLPPSMRYLGLLHGIAGVGMSLLLTGFATRQDEHAEAAIRLGDALLFCADIREGAEGETYTWPRRLGDDGQATPALCHGATGIGLFLIRLWLASGEQRFRSAAIGAAREAAASKKTGVSLCHGAAGDVALLLSTYQATNEAWLLNEARSLALKSVLPIALREGSPDPGEPSIDCSLMLGQAGLAATLDRLANVEALPDLVFRS